MSIGYRKTKKSVDWVALTVFFALLIIGWLMLYAAVYEKENPNAFLDFSSVIGKQTAWMAISLVAFVIVYTIDWDFWNTFAIPIYILSIILLILVLFIGPPINGSRSWFVIGGASIQPSEFAKFATVLAISSYLSSFKSDIRNRNTLLVALGMLLLPMLLILLQSDAGSALIFTSFFILFYKQGLSPLYYIMGFALLTLFISSLMFSPHVVSIMTILVGIGVYVYHLAPSWRSWLLFAGIGIACLLLYFRGLYPYGIGLGIFVFLVYSYLMFRERMIRILVLVLPSVIIAIGLSYGAQYAFEKGLEPHQKDRINVWLNPSKSDPQGARYNIIQSKMAIGSGGLQGKGYLKGEMTNLNYVPEQNTDFIFSTVGEEQGFLGSAAIIFLFTLLIVRMVIIAERSKNSFIHNYAYGVAGIIFLHVFINIGMAIGLMPIIGIPLPFLSKGGSSLLGFTVMIAVLLRMDMARFRVG